MSIPELRGAELLREGETYARVIVAWHREIGLNMAPARMVYDGEPREESLKEYRDAVAFFADSDLGTLEVQAKLARTQISGTFEWFYHEVIPTSIWNRFAEVLRSQPPGHLFEAARHIQQLHQSFASIQQIQPEIKEPTPEFHTGDRGVTVRFSSHDDLQQLARHHYADYIQEEHAGIGGANFLLSISLERSTERAGEVTLLAPEYLGFELDRESVGDHLLSRLRAGEIRIESLDGF